ncbi:phosphotransferase [Embleya sp. NPDC020630]|uniref:phosphotransferase n=1 Tax=Embleya sp. NPDC020630 TaxID=3363979 RepID=UPI0037ADA6EF
MDPLLAAALTALDVTETPQPLSPHHTDAWRTTDWKIKTAVNPGGTASLLHEARAVALLREAGLTTMTAAHGESDGGAWAAFGWLPGTTLWQWCRPTRDNTAPADFAGRLRAVAAAAFTALESRHAAGWRHGDIHPDNILISPDESRVDLIDHDLAHHPRLLPLPGPYRGGGDQATAPEIARRLLDTAPDVDLELTDAAEIYSLGAAIRWAWTGATPATDRMAGPGVAPGDVLEDIATTRRRVPLTDARPWVDAELEALIDTAMTLEPGERTVAGALARLSPRRPSLPRA